MAVRLLIRFLLLLTLAPASVSAQTCSFARGFKALQDQIPDTVGNCLENERFNQTNGNAEQRTTGGLLVWRKADNWTAFTNGSTTWINGPYGLQSRPNSGPLFPWEGGAARDQQPARLAAPGDVIMFSDLEIRLLGVYRDSSLPVAPGLHTMPNQYIYPMGIYETIVLELRNHGTLTYVIPKFIAIDELGREYEQSHSGTGAGQHHYGVMDGREEVRPGQTKAWAATFDVPRGARSFSFRVSTRGMSYQRLPSERNGPNETQLDRPTSRPSHLD